MEIKANDRVRIDKYVMDNTDISRSKVKRMIDSGNILVNNKKVKASYNLKLDDNIYINDDYTEEVEIKPENIPLDIVYEDDYLLVVNKKSGMVVHPAVGNYSEH